MKKTNAKIDKVIGEVVNEATAPVAGGSYSNTMEVSPVATKNGVDFSSALTPQEIAAIKDILGVSAITSLVSNLSNLQGDTRIALREIKDEINECNKNMMRAVGDGFSLLSDRVCETLAAESHANRTNLTSVVDKVGDKVGESRWYRKDPIFYSTYNEESQKLWKEKLNGVIAGVRLSDTAKTKDEICEVIYSKMMEKDGYNVKDLFERYKSNAVNPGSVSIIDMCAESDALRHSVEKCVNGMYYKAAKMVSPRIYYHQANGVPANIREIVSGLSSTGNPTGRTYKKAKKILSDNGIDVNKLRRNVMKKYHLGSCNVWFAVSNFPDVVKVLIDNCSYSEDNGAANSPSLKSSSRKEAK